MGGGDAEAEEKPLHIQESLSFIPLEGEPSASGSFPTSTTSPGVVPVRKQAAAWRQARFTDELSDHVVKALFAAHRGEALEHRLRPKYRAELEAELRETQAAIQDIAKLYVREVDRVKRALHEKPSRMIVLDALQRERDPAYPTLLQVRSAVESSGRGAVWGDVEGRKEIHFIIYWSEWPELKALVDNQAELVLERRSIVRRWIREHYQQAGMELFSTHH